MTNTLKAPLNRLLKIGFAEGISYIVLLGIAMPLKYIAHMPTPVRVIGMIHGILFIMYIFALIHATIVYHWKFKIVLIAFLLSFLPFGTFFLDRILKKN